LRDDDASKILEFVTSLARHDAACSQADLKSTGGTACLLFCRELKTVVPGRTARSRYPEHRHL